MSAHNDSSLAAVGLAALVLAAIGWRACTRSSPPSPGDSAVEPISSIGATTGAPARPDAAALPSCRAPALGTACTSQLADAGDGEPSAGELEHLVSADPSRALDWIARANLREGQPVEARAALEVRALVALQRIGSAQAQLQHFAERYPSSPELPALVRLTGYHPRPPLRRPQH